MKNVGYIEKYDQKKEIFDFEICNDFEKISKTPIQQQSIQNQLEGFNDFLLIDNSKYSDKNVLSENEWNMILNNRSQEEIIKNEKAKITESLEYGISHYLREKIWIYLSKSETLEMNYKSDYYNSLCNWNSYKNNTIINNINKDIKRTFISNAYNTEEIQHKLFNILYAYSLYDKSHGYAQGTNFIILTLLKVIKSEKDTFWLFLTIMVYKYWKDIYIPGSEMLNSYLGKLWLHLKIKVPQVYEFLNKVHFYSEFPAAFSQYFYTLFSYGDYEEITFRIFDLFWIYGGDIIVETLVNLIKLNKNIILNQSPEMLCSYFSKQLLHDAINKNGIDNCIPKFKLKRIWSFQNIKI